MKKYEMGIICGMFDIIHPGYIKLIQAGTEQCGWITIALHEDPSIENPKKSKPVFSLLDRMRVVQGLKGVNAVYPYKTEAQLDELFIANSDALRIMGGDWEGVERPGITNPVFYLPRTNHSATMYKSMIIDAFIEEQKK